VSNLTGADDYQPLSEAEVARRVGFPNHDTRAEIKTLQAMIQQPPFPGQSNYIELVAYLNNKQERIKREVGSLADVIQRRQDIVREGLADWKIYYELAVLNQRLRNPSAMYHFLNKVLEVYPHNRETYMKLAEALSRDGKWREAIPYLEQSLYYTRGDKKKIAETINWLGTAHLRTGDYDRATDLLLEVTDKYPDQVDLTLRAYGNLIRYAREQGKLRDLDRYVTDVQRYARSLIRKEKDKEFPLLYQRMSQIMSMGGFEAEAREWAKAQPQ